VTFLITILIFSALIVIHEFGHFLAARQAGVRVEKFSIGFGPELLRINGKQTQFLICAFPLGGYVKMAGDSRGEHKGAKDEFLSQPVGVKMRIVFAGPLFNYLFAFVLFCLIFFLGFPYSDTIVGSVLEGYPAQAAGIETGDRITEVNSKPVNTWQEVVDVVYDAEGKVILSIERANKQLVLEVPLKKEEILDNFGRKKNVSIMGISASSQRKIVRYGFLDAIFQGGKTLLNLTFLIVKGFLFMILGIIPFKEAVAGPVGIFYITSEAAKVGLTAVLQLAAVLNVSLAVINLVPFPVLDGGHILFFLIEKIRGKPLKEKTEDILTRLGMGLLGVLIIFVFYNDIMRFGPRIWKRGSQEISIDKSH